MKKHLLILNLKTMKKILILLCLPFITLAQTVPQGINYQAVARDVNGNELINQFLTVKLSIISASSTGNISWQETHPVTTNNFGLFTAVIGQGASTGSGTIATFDILDWGIAPHYLKVEIDDGSSGFIDLGTNELMSVPYALQAGNPGPIGPQGPAGSLVSGTSGQTLRHNGTDWVATSNLSNDGSIVSTDGDMNINGITVGNGGGNVIFNTASGNNALRYNTTGYNNTASGYRTLYFNITGNDNTASGKEALFSNTIGNNNTASGYKALYSNTTGDNNTASGYRALYLNTTGDNNSASGYYALYSNITGNFNTASGTYALSNNTTGYNNTASGYKALYFNTTGNQNTASGNYTLYNNTTGNKNTASGNYALYLNTIGYNNTASGYYTLYSNTTGNFNTASGYKALRSNTTGSNNTALGNNTLRYNTTGHNNTALGNNALRDNTTGDNNTASGYYTLYSNTTGYSNTASGYYALYSNTTGSNNTALGNYALYLNTIGYNNSASGYKALRSNTTGNFNTALGTYALSNNTTGDYNTALGNHALYWNTTGNNNTVLGYNAECTGSNQIRLGNSSVSSIGGYASWSNVSDARFKTNIKEDVKGLDFINKLRPVTYNLDMDAIAQFHNTPDSLRLKEGEVLKGAMLQSGFIAQEVERAAQELGYDFSGVDKPQNDKDSYGLRYAEFVVPLVKAVQEQQAMIQQLEEKITQLENK